MRRIIEVRMELPKENICIRKSLRTRSEATAKDAERTDFTPIRLQPPLRNQPDDRDKR